MTINMHGINVTTPIKIDQFGLLNNIATTGHKLQGMSKDIIIVSDWSYIRNWVYVVLSRVRKLSGLYLQTPLDPLKCYKADQPLEDETARLLEVEMNTLKDLILTSYIFPNNS